MRGYQLVVHIQLSLLVILYSVIQITILEWLLCWYPCYIQYLSLPVILGIFLEKSLFEVLKKLQLSLLFRYC
jgi:hypothetical protein